MRALVVTTLAVASGALLWLASAAVDGVVVAATGVGAVLAWAVSGAVGVGTGIETGEFAGAVDAVIGAGAGVWASCGVARPEGVFRVWNRKSAPRLSASTAAIPTKANKRLLGRALGLPELA